METSRDWQWAVAHLNSDNVDDYVDACRLLDRLSDESRLTELDRPATSALGYPGDRRAVGPLRKAAVDPSDRVRRFAADALERLEGNV